MKYYLVRGTVTLTRYMSDHVETTEDIRLVRADSPGEAERKFDKYWTDQSDEYSHTYWTSGDCLETIE